MPVFSSPDGSLNILFIHIPKTGGGSVEHFFKKINFGVKYLQTKDAPNTLKLSCYKCSPQHMHAALLEMIFNIHSFDYVFTLVRHPFNRLLSEYKWNIAKNKLSRNGINDFYINSRRLYANNPYALDNHLRPQIEFITEKTRIFKLEDGIDSALKTVLSELSINVKDPGQHIINQKSKRTENLLQNPKLSPLLAQESCTPNSTIKELIKIDYRRDFEDFSYSFDF
ncbi:sulfotransferase family protein [Synechococcus sp. AH-736-G21]|nr:sulfotransferase family protein [Synechococcus sp. AH-736-G21]